MIYRFAFALTCLLLPSPALAMFIQPQLETVPVDRLVTNMEKMIADNPQDALLQYNLARLHAMAFAKKADQTTIWKGREKQGAWFGHTPKHIPFGEVEDAPNAEAKKKSKQHLAKALANYQEALKLNPKMLAADLGLAWCIEQSGDTDAAIVAYRNVVDKAWAKESKLRFGSLGGSYITAEAAGYLIPLLHRDKDKDEIADLAERRTKLMRLPRPVTPIAVPLVDGLAAVDIIDDEASVAFDLDGSGLEQRWTWIKPNAAWLVHDMRDQGEITSGLQLFGSVTFWCFWEHGYDALAALDDNGDGQLTGGELAHLALWHDANANGLSEPGEVRSLAEDGIVALSCRYRKNGTSAAAVAYSLAGVTFRDGAQRATYDVVLNKKISLTVR